MITAQRISEDVKAQAKKEAEVVIAEAELQGDKIIAGANNRLVELVSDLNELKRQKVQFEAQLESLIEGHRKLLDTFKTPSQGEVAYLVKKSEPA
jgi:cell division initiation protein